MATDIDVKPSARGRRESRLRATPARVTLVLVGVVLAVLAWTMRPYVTGSGADAVARAECVRDYARARTAAETAAVDPLVRGGGKVQGVAPVSCGAYRRAGLLRR